MGTVVTLGSLTFNDLIPDADGVVWGMRELEGWDSAELREDLADRDQAHGQHRGASYYGGRLLVARGLIRCPSLAAQRTARYKLLAATDLTDADATLTVQESPSKQAAVRRAGRPVVKTIGDRLLDYDIPLRAVDPRKYATSVTTITIAAGATATGTIGGGTGADTPLHVKLKSTGGAGVVFTDNISGQTVTVTAGATVVDLDTLDGTVLAGSTPAWSRVSAGTDVFFSVRGGQSYSFTATGANGAEITYRAAWA